MLNDYALDIESKVEDSIAGYVRMFQDDFDGIQITIGLPIEDIESNAICVRCDEATRMENVTGNWIATVTVSLATNISDNADSTDPSELKVLHRKRTSMLRSLFFIDDHISQINSQEYEFTAFASQIVNVSQSFTQDHLISNLTFKLACAGAKL